MEVENPILEKPQHELQQTLQAARQDPIQNSNSLPTLPKTKVIQLKNGQQYILNYLIIDEQNYKGVLRDSQTQLIKYEGEFREKHFHGQGKLYLGGSDFFQGTFELGKKKQGKLVKGGCEFQGELENDLPQGKGMIIFKDQSQYEGSFNQGRLDGQGQYIRVYKDFTLTNTGSWVNGKREGEFLIQNNKNSQKMTILYKQGCIFRILNFEGTLKDFGFEKNQYFRAVDFSSVLQEFQFDDLSESNSTRLISKKIKKTKQTRNKLIDNKNQNTLEIIKKKDRNMNKQLNKQNAKEIFQSQYYSKYKKQLQSAEAQQHECCICLDTIENNQQIKNFPCAGNHFFHAECINNWLKQKYTCPECRYDIVENTPLNKLEGDGNNMLLKISHSKNQYDDYQEYLQTQQDLSLQLEKQQSELNCFLLDNKNEIFNVAEIFQQL